MNPSPAARPVRESAASETPDPAVALSLATDAAAGEHSEGDRPTIVLVHGAFADSSSWNEVVGRLKRDRFPVVAPANPLRGLTSDANYLRSFLESVEGPIVLAGHSYGGAVISEAAAGNTNVKALVYIAAFAPEEGESALELSNKFPGSTLGSTLKPVTFPLADGGTGTDLYIDADEFHQQFAADVPVSVSALMAATQRPVTTAALEERATQAAWKTIPSWNLVTTQDLNIPVAVQRFMARRAQSHTTEVNASHAVSVSQPGAVARLIEQAARTAN
ncbi:alpha/beta fold hydrolase [Streptomyces sp. NPDC059459]|uniref:alpha/beta fold hydrolase n=1 Tax=Streptomyces sp. NPDC059459 TaxID=3346839 RepID=UPI00367970F5